jgi:hypothetical protein
MMVDVEGYKGLYKISKDGKVFSIKKNNFIKPYFNKNTGYMFYSLHKDGQKKNIPVHRLLAKAFIENKDNKPYINHKDGNKLNNAIDNLEWCTQSHNMKEAFRLGLAHSWCGTKYGIEHPNYKFRGKWKTQKKVVQYDLELNTIREFNSATEAERDFGYSCGHISECCRGIRKTACGFIWKYKVV